ncbi:MAG: NGG1p interacting factor NIF3 [Candidatus Aureabacteria bacterium]|nr:NGG1p interacting factor NIF3 [Candidatus Auribacterota bacterium]
MKLGAFFARALAEGQKNDPRGQIRVHREMKALRSAYEEMSKRGKRAFDKERLDNPYADTRILFGEASAEMRGLLVGVDIDVGEITLADRLRQRGAKIDLVMSHHPVGRAYAGFYNVMRMQADIVNMFGVPINIAESLLEDRIREVEHRVMPLNTNRAVDAARLLGIPLACIHTPADNCATSFLQRLFDRKKPECLGEIIDLLEEIPEYQAAIEGNVPPRILSGKDGRRTGRIFVDMTGGTEGSVKILEKLAQAGVGTLVGMHLSEKHLEEAKKHSINVVIAGHIASDTLGLNLLLDATCRKERMEITCCSGFARVERK